MKCKIEVYDSKTQHVPGNLLATYTLSNLRFSGADEDRSTDANVASTLNFTTDRMNIVGFGF
mgnify:FL=1